jgi:hypothetical protein
MPKQLILYNLAEGISKEDYQKYVDEKKGPFFVGLPAVTSYTLMEIKSEDSPCQYAGIVETDNPAELQKATQSPAFGEFLQEWMPKVKDVQIMFGVEVYQGKK